MTSIAVEDDIVAVGNRYDDQGGFNAGAVHVFQRSRVEGASLWSPVAELLGKGPIGSLPGNELGYHVSLSGGLLAVGSANFSAVRLYRRH